MYKITSFKSKSTKLKTPISPFDDLSFVFETHEVNENQLLHILVNDFILNIPLDIQEPLRTRRKKSILKDKVLEDINYLILDIDKIKTLDDRNRVINYFSKFKCILMESKSYNGIDNFNLKGFLFCDLKVQEAKFALSYLHNDLIDICDVDEATGRIGSLNAPIGKLNVILNSNGNILTFQDVDVRQKSKSDIKIVIKEDENTTSVQELCLSIFQNMGFTALRENEDSSISFKHVSETKTPGGYFWFKSSPFTMHHFNKSKNINIFNEVRKLPKFKELTKQNLDYDKKLVQEFNNFEVISVNQKFLKVDDFLESKIRTFLERNDGLFAIRSPMGTGKSTVISDIIQEAHEQDMRVLIITNRISVAEDFGKKYNLKIYNKDKYQIGDSLICQFDSLHKYNIQYFDLVIIDEFISVLLHSRNAMSSSPINISKMFASLKKKLVIADAFLTGYELNILRCKKENCFLLDNTFRDGTKVNLFENFNYFILKILETAKKEKITISSTSLSVIKALQLLLSKHGIKVVTLTSETPEGSKELVYKYFEDENNTKWDCLIYSPTLTVGVSNLNNVKKHFHYDSSITCDCISSLQMLKRTRKVEEINIFIKERTDYLKTSYESLRDDYLSNVGKSFDYNFIFSINDYGEPVISKLGKKIIQLDVLKNILEYNHREAFLWLLKYHFKDKVQVVENTFSQNILFKYQKDTKLNSDNLVRNCIEQFLELNDIEYSEIDVNDFKIYEKLIESSKDLDCDDKTKVEILKLNVADKAFIKKCRMFKYFHDYSAGILTKDFIQNKISNLIMKNTDSCLMEFLVKLVQINPSNFSFEYIGKLDSKLKCLLTKCGYKVYNDEISTLGIRKFECNREVKKYFNYINY